MATPANTSATDPLTQGRSGSRRFPLRQQFGFLVKINQASTTPQNPWAKTQAFENWPVELALTLRDPKNCMVITGAKFRISSPGADGTDEAVLIPVISTVPYIELQGQDPNQAGAANPFYNWSQLTASADSMLAKIVSKANWTADDMDFEYYPPGKEIKVITSDLYLNLFQGPNNLQNPLAVYPTVTKNVLVIVELLYYMTKVSAEEQLRLIRAQQNASPLVNFPKAV